MNWSRVERSMLGLEKKAKGFTLIELLVVIAIIGFISSLSYPSFSSWIETRNTNDAVTKVETAFRSITTQIQRGVYPFVQIHVENSKDKIIIVTRGMGQENFNQNRSTLNCSLDENYWDNKKRTEAKVPPILSLLSFFPDIWLINLFLEVPTKIGKPRL